MICHICDKIKHQGNVCHKCRLLFEPLSESVYEFHLSLDCHYCDDHGFPCKRCAKYTYEYNLGLGNGDIDDFSDNNDILDLDTDTETKTVLSLDEIKSCLHNKNLTDMGLLELVL